MAMGTVGKSSAKITAVALVNEQMEIIRNLAFEKVGIQGGLPDGSIPHVQTLTRDGFDFTVTTVVRNVDDPFDGKIGSTTHNDLSPADYRLVEITIECATCQDFTPMAFTTNVGPRNLESASTNGALFVQVFDASGQPIQGADVHVENNIATTTIVIDDTTDINGFLQIIDAPPGVNAYEISVSKPGYSSSQSYLPGDVANPNPVIPHTTVLAQQLSQTSFSIDKTSQLDFLSMTNTCVPVGGVDFDLSGGKIIGTLPDLKKFTGSYTTDGSGNTNLTDIEWDTYSLDLTDAGYDLVGTIPTMPFSINPDSQQSIALVVAPKDSRTLLVTVKDSGTRLPISTASVQLEDGGYDTTYITGYGFTTQTDWVGGGGQSSYIDVTRYFSDDGSIETASTPGQLQLKDVFGTYAPNGVLTSSTFDTGTSSTFQQILWQPQSQPPAAGADSVRFQIATNNDNATWDFKGPDGTSGTYYDLTNQDINAVHAGNRYLRYKLFMQTADTAWTPVVSDISFNYTSSCVPAGQTAFSGLGSGVYDITVSKTGYATYTGNVSVSSDWQQVEILLAP
jgi:hypothetical protein